MTRRKSVCCSQWTLVILVVLICPVYPRPQDTSSQSTVISSSTNSVQIDKATESPIRYRFRNSLHLSSIKLPIVIGFVNRSSNELDDTLENKLTSKDFFALNVTNVDSQNRKSRLITNKVKNGSRKKLKPNNKVNQDMKNENIVSVSPERRKPEIRKILTKWTDEVKYEDLDFSYETSTSTEHEGDTVAFTNSLGIDEYTSTENFIDQSTEAVEKYPHPQSTNKLSTKVTNKLKYRPNSQFSEGSIVHSNKVHIIDKYPFPHVRPNYIYTTPKPTPIITNLGAPKPWTQHHQNTHRRPATKKPVRVTKPLKGQYNVHNNHNSVQNYYPPYSNTNFEVTTFQPSNAYTERIVIRPSEYSASSDDCPTIYLTLNNTFQGQAKEACPDLNIAVNTNVVNKNVVVESEEEGIEDGVESLFPGTFGLPLGEDSAAEDGDGNDYFESEESQEQAQSASIEETEFSNYNAANSAIQSDYSEPGSVESPNSGLSAIKRPGRPNKDEEDLFSFSGLTQYFQPAFKAMSWLAAVSPLSFGMLSLFLAPLALLFAGYSGTAALLAPLGLAREAPKVVHVYRPQWEWDYNHKTWHLNTFPNNRRWKPRLPRTSKESETEVEGSVKSTWFYRAKEWMRSLTKTLTERDKNKNLVQNIRKNKRKKRETWTKRIK